MSKMMRVNLITLLFSVSGVVISLLGHPMGMAFAFIGFGSALANGYLGHKYPSWKQLPTDT